MINLYYNNIQTSIDEEVAHDEHGDYIKFEARSEIYRFIRELFELLRNEEEQT